MNIITSYPREAIKLYHRKAGQVIQLCKNDGSVDSNIYIVTNKQTQTHTGLINLANGVESVHSVSCKTILLKNAKLVINSCIGESE